MVARMRTAFAMLSPTAILLAAATASVAGHGRLPTSTTRYGNVEEDVLPVSRSPPLPRLGLDAGTVSISGISSGADFAVYFSVAHSRSVVGAGVFAGNVYRCYSTRFPGDILVNCSEYAALEASVAGCKNVDSLQAPCDASVEACPPGFGLVRSKCQGCAGAASNYVSAVNVTTLLHVAERRAGAGLIDPLHYVKRGRYWLYRGSKDMCYRVGSVDHAADFYERLGGQVTFVNSTVPSLHCIPTLTDGTPCGVEGNYTESHPHALEACGFDGAGECLKHIYGTLASPVQQQQSSLRFFDQLEFDLPNAGLDPRGGFVYIPVACEKSGANCKLHVFTHGCGQQAAAASYKFNDTYARRAGFNEWAEANNIVILYPQLHYGDRASCAAQKGDCWDQEGTTGEHWADKDGQQVKAVKAMIDKLTSSEQSS